MLSYLSVRNLAIIAKAEVELEDGFTVITGETGAGKSMLLRAIEQLLGSTVMREQIRSGATDMVVEGAWSLPHPSEELVEALPLDPDDEFPEELTVRRSVRFLEKSKRDRFHLAGRLVTLTQARLVAEHLVNLSSQHESIRLLKTTEHIHVLDRFGVPPSLLEEMEKTHKAWNDLEKRRRAFEERLAHRTQRMEELQDLIAELERLDLSRGEEEKLEEQIHRLNHSVDIGEALQFAVSTLYEEDGDVVSNLGKVVQQLQSILRYDAGMGNFVDRLSGAQEEVDDISQELRRRLAETEFNPEALDHLQSKLAGIQKARRKFQVADGDALVDLLEESRSELNDLGDSQASMGALVAQCNQAKEAMLAAAFALHDQRKQVAADLIERITAVLHELEMKKARFGVKIHFNADGITASGGDDVEFLLAPNPGSPLNPLKKIASGGELSRVLLAIKAVVSNADEVPTYIFDEIDAGIGGKTAISVGRLLAQLAGQHQVFCITHTAQLAAYADHHIVVRKHTRDGQTYAEITTLLDRKGRVEELARMLSGMEESQTALSHAEELLDAAEDWRGRKVDGPEI